MRTTRKVLALSLVLAALTLTLAACSGSGGSSPAGPETYTNSDYGFSITYDPMFDQGDPESGTGTGGGSVFDIAFANPDGARADDRLVDGIQVSVYKLARVVKPSEVPKLKKEFAGIVTEMMGSLTSASVTQDLSPIEVNGVPGFGLAYSYEQDGTPVQAVTYFLVKGEYEYQITGQASQENWETLKNKLDAAAKSFKVE